MRPSDQPITLKRTLSLPTTAFYGIGTIIGAGIYVLVGKVAVAAGPLLPFAFLLAGLIAALTAFSYAELSSRYPQSAGSAVYIDECWRIPRLTQLVGALVVLTGVISAATITKGFVGYLQLFASISPVVATLLLITLLAMIAIKESAWTITVITLIELSGILYVLLIGGISISKENHFEWAAITWDQKALLAIVTGSFLVFYAFIGFKLMPPAAQQDKVVMI